MQDSQEVCGGGKHDLYENLVLASRSLQISTGGPRTAHSVVLWYGLGLHINPLMPGGKDPCSEPVALNKQ